MKATARATLTATVHIIYMGLHYGVVSIQHILSSYVVVAQWVAFAQLDELGSAIFSSRRHRR